MERGKGGAGESGGRGPVAEGASAVDSRDGGEVGGGFDVCGSSDGTEGDCRKGEGGCSEEGARTPGKTSAEEEKRRRKAWARRGGRPESAGSGGGSRRRRQRRDGDEDATQRDDSPIRGRNAKTRRPRGGDPPSEPEGRQKGRRWAGSEIGPPWHATKKGRG